MKKHFLGGILILVLCCTAACDNTKKTEDDTAENDTRVVDRDSVATEYEVTETVVEYDTTKKKKTVSAEADKNERADEKADAKVKKDRD